MSGTVPFAELDEILGYLAEVCRDLSVRWALLGGVASNLYRDRPRLTQDVDVTIEIDRSRWPKLAARLSADGWTLQPQDAYPDVLLLRGASRLAVDVLLAKTEYQRGALDRAVPQRLALGATVPVLAPEDIIIHKLIAGRHTDIDDIERILAADSALDLVYLEQWIDAWDVRDRWEQIRPG